jgi:hypothetical protein
VLHENFPFITLYGAVAIAVWYSRRNLPIAVGLALPDGEKPAAIDRQFAVFQQPDFSITRFISEITVDDEFLRVDFRRARRTRAGKSIAVILSISVRP